MSEFPTPWRVVDEEIHDANGTVIADVGLKWHCNIPLDDLVNRVNAADIRNAEIKELEQKQEGTEEAMHQRIRATYDKAVAECWRSKVKELVDALEGMLGSDPEYLHSPERDTATALLSKYRGDA